MRRFIKTALALVVLGALGVVILLSFAPRQVTLNLANESGKPISRVQVVDDRATYNLDGIAAGQTLVFEFEPRGETTYRLIVTFADGSEVRGGDAYAEAGYVFTVAITEESVSSRFDAMWLFL